MSIGKFKKHKIYIYPTDTVWGIGANIYDKSSNELINIIKKTKEKKPLSILYSDLTQIEKDFKINECLEKEFFKKILTMEVTLVVDLKYAKIAVPEWIHQNSPKIYLRCLNYKFLDEIIKQEQAPITTTSLNISGDSPIKNYAEADLFLSNISSSKTFEIKLLKDSDVKCSGHASSIIQLDDGIVRFVREGKRVDEIKKLCGLFSAKLL